MSEDPRSSVTGAESGYPYVASPSFATVKGTPYLRVPGVHLVAKPSVSLDSLREFLGGFSPDLNFAQYVDDPMLLEPGAQLCKLAGQVCYASFGVKRSYNADA